MSPKSLCDDVAENEPHIVSAYTFRTVVVLITLATLATDIDVIKGRQKYLKIVFKNYFCGMTF